MIFTIIFFSKIGEFNVQLFVPGVGLIGRPLWVRNRQLGNVWLRGHVTIPRSESFSAYSLVFEGIIGQGHLGDVALDEIKLLPNRYCPPTNEHGALVTHTCDFEDPDICDYFFESLDSDLTGTWERKKADSLLYPATDNTYQTNAGHFMLHQVNIFLIFKIIID